FIADPVVLQQNNQLLLPFSGPIRRVKCRTADDAADGTHEAQNVILDILCMERTAPALYEILQPPRKIEFSIPAEPKITCAQISSLSLFAVRVKNPLSLLRIVKVGTGHGGRTHPDFSH